MRPKPKEFKIQLKMEIDGKAQKFMVIDINNSPYRPYVFRSLTAAKKKIRWINAQDIGLVAKLKIGR